MFLAPPSFPSSPGVFAVFASSLQAAKVKARMDESPEKLRGSFGREQLEPLLRQNAEAIYTLCYHVGGARESADLAQLAMERIVTRFEQFDPERGSFRSWALTVARNVCRDRLRRRGLERGAFVNHPDPEGAAVSGSPDPERLAIARDDVADLSEALTQLPEGQRSAVVLFHVHEESYEDIAHTLGVPKGTVMTWLHRGRKKLRALLTARHEGTSER